MFSTFLLGNTKLFGGECRGVQLEEFMTDVTAVLFRKDTCHLVSVCSAGTFAANAGASVCDKCAAGTSTNSSTGAASCSLCEAGQFAPEGAARCTPCAPGSFSPYPSGQCLPCAPGTYNDEVGQARCKACPEGQRQPVAGSIACDVCSA